jgi:hypothetical protein
MQLTPEQINLLGLPKGSTVTLSIESPKPEKWKPKHVGSGYRISSSLNIIATCNHPDIPPINLFPSSMLAEDACNAITSYLRQLAWLRENGDGWFADWDNDCQIKHRITYDRRSEKWVIQQAYVTYTPGVIYMSKPTADKLVDLLNSGIVEF